MSALPTKSDQESPRNDSYSSRPASIWRGHSFRALGLLIFIFIVAAVFPEPGRELGAITLHTLSSGEFVRIHHALLAGLLFCAGLNIETARVPRHSFRMLPLSALGTWVTPCATVGLIAFFAKLLHVPDDIILGLIIVASMPIANSAVGWAHVGGGNLPLSLAMLIAATVTAPLVAPSVVTILAGLSQLSLETQKKMVFSPAALAYFLTVWVLAPVLCGILTGVISRRFKIKWSRRWLSGVSLFCLLALNYINAASAFHEIRSEEIFVIALIVTAVSNTILFATAWALTRVFRAPLEDAISYSLACGMRNTGAALVLAAAMLKPSSTVIITILLHTILQHLLAGAFVTWVQRRPETDVTNPVRSVSE